MSWSRGMTIATTAANSSPQPCIKGGLPSPSSSPTSSHHLFTTTPRPSPNPPLMQGGE